MQLLPSAVVVPQPEVVVDRLPLGKVVPQRPPGTAVVHDIQHDIDDLAALVAGGSTARLRRWDQRFDLAPLGIGVGSGIHVDTRRRDAGINVLQTAAADVEPHRMMLELRRAGAR